MKQLTLHTVVFRQIALHDGRVGDFIFCTEQPEMLRPLKLKASSGWLKIYLPIQLTIFFN